MAPLRSLPRATALWLPVCLCLAIAAPGARGELPEEGACPALAGRPGRTEVADAAPVRIREGMVLDYTDLVLLRELIPVEVWRHRNVFFFEGMRMEIGPCHRRYPEPPHYQKATERFSGRSRVDEDGNLLGYAAGLPFPPEAIAGDDPEAGIKWAWNLEHRYRGAGPHGRFRITDMPSRVGGTQVYTGTFFHLRTRHRADLAENDFTHGDADESLWIGGGEFETPFDARHLAWRQMRPARAQKQYTASDDTFVYVPTMRKVRRAATTWVDGMYTPRYRIGGDWGGGGLPVVSGGSPAPTGAVNPTSALSAAITEHLRAGFVSFAIRPNAYVWRVLGEREVLAPINGSRSGYPYDPERNFGPAGLSVGSDRWEVRQAVVIEGAIRQRGEGFETIQIYVDVQTRVPLYLVTRRQRGIIVDIGIPVHRFSGDVLDYPSWPGAERARVFDPVAAVFYRAADGGSGWRRESYDVRSVPPPETKLRRMTSTDFLLRGH